MKRMFAALFAVLFLSSVLSVRARAAAPTLSAASAILVDGFKTLAEGQKVSYDTEPDPKDAGKLRAVNVIPQ